MATFYLSAFADEAGESLKEQIDALRANGIGKIEPRNIDGKVVIDMTDAEQKDVYHRLCDNGITVGSLGSPIGKYPIHDPFGPHYDRFLRALDCAHNLGTDRMRMFSFFVGQDELKECRADVIDRLGKMLEEAKKQGIILCHENESAIYGQMPAQAKDLLASLPDLRGIHDPANYVLNGADPIEGINATLTRFEYMHVKDASLSEGVILPAGEGEGRIAETLALIDKAVDGPVMLTVEPHLFAFKSFKNINADAIKGRHSFDSDRAAFDFAIGALKGVLEKEGYKKVGTYEWKK